MGSLLVFDSLNRRRETHGQYATDQSLKYYRIASVIAVIWLGGSTYFVLILNSFGGGCTHAGLNTRTDVTQTSLQP